MRRSDRAKKRKNLAESLNGIASPKWIKDNLLEAPQMTPDMLAQLAAQAGQQQQDPQDPQLQGSPGQPGPTLADLQQMLAAQKGGQQPGQPGQPQDDQQAALLQMLMGGAAGGQPAGGQQPGAPSQGDPQATGPSPDLMAQLAAAQGGGQQPAPDQQGAQPGEQPPANIGGVQTDTGENGDEENNPPFSNAGKNNLRTDGSTEPSPNRYRQPGPGDEKAIVKFLSENPKATDDDFHQFARKLGIDPHKAELVIMKLAREGAAMKDKEEKDKKKTHKPHSGNDHKAPSKPDQPKQEQPAEKSPVEGSKGSPGDDEAMKRLLSLLKQEESIELKRESLATECCDKDDEKRQVVIVKRHSKQPEMPKVMVKRLSKKHKDPENHKVVIKRSGTVVISRNK